MCLLCRMMFQGSRLILERRLQRVTNGLVSAAQPCWRMHARAHTHTHTHRLTDKHTETHTDTHTHTHTHTHAHALTEHAEQPGQQPALGPDPCSHLHHILCLSPARCTTGTCKGAVVCVSSRQLPASSLLARVLFFFFFLRGLSCAWQTG